jgi:hypothetical protein
MRRKVQREAGQKAAATRKANPPVERVMPVETVVVATLPASVALGRRDSSNDISFNIKQGKVLGNLVMGRGSVRWKAENAKKPTGEWTWTEFVRLLNSK